MRLASLRTAGFLTAFDYLQNLLHYGFHPAVRDTIDDISAWGTVISLLILYWAGYRIVQRDKPRIAIRTIAAWAGIFSVIATATIPYDSTDAYFYMAMGWAQSHYGLNPYSQTLREIPDPMHEPMLSADWMQQNKNPWLDFPMVYGFGFATLCRLFAWIGGGHWLLTLMLFKGFNLICWALVGIILWDATRLLGVARVDSTLYLFLWCPLLLLHHLANGHNDLIVGTCVAAAFYLLVSGEFLWAVPLLTLGFFVKYAIAPLIPLVFLYVWRKNRNVAIQSVFPSVIVSLILGLPYLRALPNFKWNLIFAQLAKTTAGSPFSALYYLYRVTKLSGLERFGSILKGGIWIGVMLYFVVTLYRCYKVPNLTIQRVISAAAVLLFATLFVGSSQFYAWYIGMIYPLVLFLEEGHWLRQFIVLSTGAQVTSLTTLARKGIGMFVIGSLLPALIVMRMTRNRSAQSG